MCIFAVVEDPSDLVVEVLDTIITTVGEEVAEAVMMEAGVEMVAGVEGETAEEAVAAEVEMEEVVAVDVRKDSYEDRCCFNVFNLKLI